MKAHHFALLLAGAVLNLPVSAKNKVDLSELSKRPPAAGYVEYTTEYVPVWANDLVLRTQGGTDQRDNPGVLQCAGQTLLLNNLSSGLQVTDMAGRTESRFGHAVDPVNASRRVFSFSIRSTDPDTSGVGAKRCELAYSGVRRNLPMTKAFWFATATRTTDFSRSADEQSIWQWANNTGAGGLRPAVAAVVKGNRLQIKINYDTSFTPSRSTSTSVTVYDGLWTPNAWVRFVAKAHFTSKNNPGMIQVWMNGTKIVDYDGSLGYRYTDNTGPETYAKVGLYHWATANTWDSAVDKRQLFSVGAVIAEHTAGYDWRSIDALLQATD